MKKLLIIALALVLASCAPVAPVVQPTAAIPPTPVVLVATVLVPVIQTQIVQATAAPTNPPEPTSPPAPTATMAPAQAPTIAPTTGAAASGGATATATLSSGAGGLSKAGEVLFTNLTRSGSYFNLRCAPQELTFGISTSNLAVVEVDFYYQMEDLTTNPVTSSPSKNLGKMTSDGHGNYTITVNTLQQLSPDLRASAKAWFDYQFVGIAKDGNRVGSSQVIAKQILYLKDCP